MISLLDSGHDVCTRRQALNEASLFERFVRGAAPVQLNRSVSVDVSLILFQDVEQASVSRTVRNLVRNGATLRFENLDERISGVLQLQTAGLPSCHTSA